MSFLLRCLVATFVTMPLLATAAVLHVGPGQDYAAPCAAIMAASSGDTVLIEAAGSYDGDVCQWSTDGLTLRGVNGRPHIDAAGASAGGRATWVVYGNDTTIENIELSGSHVADLNGGAVRQIGANLTLRHVYFHDNENGLLAGDRTGSTITIEYSEFAHNGSGDGSSHNVYVNHVDSLVFRYNWSHDAVSGQLLRSRALENHVLYNRLTGEAGSTGSYELSFPNGGLSYVIGNIFEKPSTSTNSVVLDYLSEGGSSQIDRHLFVINNTFVNHHGGTFLGVVASDPASLVRNNIFFGGGTVMTTTLPADHNFEGSTPIFIDPAHYDYRLLAGAPVINAGIDPGSGLGQDLKPTQEYEHPTAAIARPTVGVIDIGAYEWSSDVIFVDGFE